MDVIVHYFNLSDAAMEQGARRGAPVMFCLRVDEMAMGGRALARAGPQRDRRKRLRAPQIVTL